MKVLVTGGAGFIRLALVRHLINNLGVVAVNVDKLTYAGNRESLNGVTGSPQYCFCLADICDRPALERIFSEHRPDAIAHLAAESRVDRSIDGPEAFVEMNLIGTATSLQFAADYSHDSRAGTHATPLAHAKHSTAA